jgi:MFS family permease
MSHSPSQLRPLAFRRQNVLVAFPYAILIQVFSAVSTGMMLYGYKYALKDEMNLSASQMSYCNFAISLPLFCSFCFGLLRDRWRPFGMVDRPYLLVAPIVVCACCLTLGIGHRSLGRLITLLVVMNAGATLSGAAMSGMLGSLSKHFGLSGRISVAGMVVPCLAGFLLMPWTGHLVEHGGFSAVCYASTGLSLPVAVLAFLRPARLFPDEPTHASVSPTSPREPFGIAVKRLLTSRAALIAVLVCFLWDFTPGWGTPLFYQYSNVLRLTPGQIEFTYSVGTVGTMVSALAYGFFCFRIPTRNLLMVGIIVCVIGSAGLLLVHSYRSAVIVSIVVGLTYGMAEAGIYDLLYRASPPGLEGVAISLGLAATYLAGTLADVFGSFLYERGGFYPALMITLISTALILPLVVAFPSEVLAAREGKPIEPVTTLLS